MHYNLDFGDTMLIIIKLMWYKMQSNCMYTKMQNKCYKAEKYFLYS